MPNRKSINSGFAVLPVLIILSLVLLISGYFIYQYFQNKDASLASISGLETEKDVLPASSTQNINPNISNYLLSKLLNIPSLSEFNKNPKALVLSLSNIDHSKKNIPDCAFFSRGARPKNVIATFNKDGKDVKTPISYYDQVDLLGLNSLSNSGEYVVVLAPNNIPSLDVYISDKVINPCGLLIIKKPSGYNASNSVEVLKYLHFDGQDSSTLKTIYGVQVISGVLRYTFQGPDAMNSAKSFVANFNGVVVTKILNTACSGYKLNQNCKFQSRQITGKDLKIKGSASAPFIDIPGTLDNILTTSIGDTGGGSFVEPSVSIRNQLKAKNIEISDNGSITNYKWPVPLAEPIGFLSN